MSDSRIGTVIETFRRIVNADGGTLELLGVEDGTARVRYVPGHNEQCASCVLTTEDLQMLLEEAVQQQAPDVRTVRIESA